AGPPRPGGGPPRPSLPRHGAAGDAPRRTVGLARGCPRQVLESLLRTARAFGAQFDGRPRPVRAGVVDQAPAGVVTVAAVDRVGEHPFAIVWRRIISKNPFAVGRSNPDAEPSSRAPTTSSCCCSSRSTNRPSY